MQRRIFTAGIATALLIGVCANGSIAAELQAGDTFEVKASSIWFVDAAKLARWQALAKGGNGKALATYQGKVLGDRDAWQFITPLAVKIISREPARHLIKVQLTAPGRLHDTIWFLDEASLQQ